MTTWKEMLAGAGRETTLERARACIGQGTRYGLGRGGMDPTKPLTKECDCSGFVAWAIGIPRELPPGSGKWLQTTTYWKGGADVGAGLFDESSQAEPGDLIVYPDAGPKQGHMGIVSETEGGKPVKVVHCSMGNDARTKQAICETKPDVFTVNPKTRIMKVDYVALRSMFHIPESGLKEVESTPEGTRLQHPLLSRDSALQMVAGGQLVLEPTGGPVSGCGTVHDALNRLAAVHPGYLVDLGADGHLRGFYGLKTARALKTFQKDQGLPISGDLDSATLLALDAALQAMVPPAPVAVAVTGSPVSPDKVFFQKAAGGFRTVRGELIRLLQLKLKDAGSDPGIVDSIYGGGTEASLKDFQKKHGLVESGKITGRTWHKLMQAEPPRMFDRCLQLTADFEGHGFGKVAGDFDGAGLTWGIIGFTLKGGELSKMLIQILEKYPDLFCTAFGDLGQELAEVLSLDMTEQLAWARSISIGSKKYRVEQQWEDAFERLGSFPEVQQIQLQQAGKYWDEALRDAKRFQLKTERGIALCFDIAVQNGGIDFKDEERRIRQWIGQNPAAEEPPRRVVIADVIAESSKAEYVEDVRNRKRTVATGEGTVHGARYATLDWGIGEDPWC